MDIKLKSMISDKLTRLALKDPKGNTVDIDALIAVLNNFKSKEIMNDPRGVWRDIPNKADAFKTFLSKYPYIVAAIEDLGPSISVVKTNEYGEVKTDKKGNPITEVVENPYPVDYVNAVIEKLESWKTAKNVKIDPKVFTKAKVYSMVAKMVKELGEIKLDKSFTSFNEICLGAFKKIFDIKSEDYTKKTQALHAASVQFSRAGTSLENAYFIGQSAKVPSFFAKFVSVLHKLKILSPRAVVLNYVDVGPKEDLGSERKPTGYQTALEMKRNIEVPYDKAELADFMRTLKDRSGEELSEEKVMRIATFIEQTLSLAQGQYAKKGKVDIQKIDFYYTRTEGFLKMLGTLRTKLANIFKERGIKDKDAEDILGKLGSFKTATGEYDINSAMDHILNLPADLREIVDIKTRETGKGPAAGQPITEEEEFDTIIDKIQPEIKKQESFFNGLRVVADDALRAPLMEYFENLKGLDESIQGIVTVTAGVNEDISLMNELAEKLDEPLQEMDGYLSMIESMPNLINEYFGSPEQASVEEGEQEPGLVEKIKETFRPQREPSLAAAPASIRPILSVVAAEADESSSVKKDRRYVTFEQDPTLRDMIEYLKGLVSAKGNTAVIDIKTEDANLPEDVKGRLASYDGQSAASVLDQLIKSTGGEVEFMERSRGAAAANVLRGMAEVAASIPMVPTITSEMIPSPEEAKKLKDDKAELAKKEAQAMQAIVSAMNELGLESAMTEGFGVSQRTEQYTAKAPSAMNIMDVVAALKKVLSDTKAGRGVIHNSALVESFVSKLEEAINILTRYYDSYTGGKHMGTFTGEQTKEGPKPEYEMSGVGTSQEFAYKVKIMLHTLRSVINLVTGPNSEPIADADTKKEEKLRKNPQAWRAADEEFINSLEKRKIAENLRSILSTAVVESPTKGVIHPEVPQGTTLAKDLADNLNSLLVDSQVMKLMEIVYAKNKPATFGADGIKTAFKDFEQKYDAIVSSGKMSTEDKASYFSNKDIYISRAAAYIGILVEAAMVIEKYTQELEKLKSTKEYKTLEEQHETIKQREPYMGKWQKAELGLFMDRQAEGEQEEVGSDMFSIAENVFSMLGDLLDFITHAAPQLTSEVAAEASQKDSIVRVAERIAGTEIYSEYDVSGNILDLVEEADGKKKIKITKSLKNLIDNKVNRKSEFSNGESVAVDFDDHISRGTVIAHLGSGMYKVLVSGTEWSISKSRIFRS